MANTGKGRKTSLIKTNKQDGQVVGTVHYSMVTPLPAGRTTPPGWTAVTEASVRNWTINQYKDAYNNFLNACGVPAAQIPALLAAAEYDEDACQTNTPLTPWLDTNHMGSGRYDTRLDAYNLGTDFVYTLYTADGSLSAPSAVAIDLYGSLLVSDGWYRAQHNNFPDTPITMQVLNGVIAQVLMGDPTETGNPGEGGDGPIVAP